jgi:Ca-activated chloride channel family protein
LLVLLIAQPQLIDVHSKVSVDGIDIVLVLDVSGSMQYPSSARDKRSRFHIAQDEAIRFIQKRNNDAMGVVFFGGEVVTRCPLTLDKHVLEHIVRDVKIGDLDPNKTMLASGMMAAVNRLKSSKSKSKVIILLTDGEPSQGDLSLNTAIEITKKFGIKVYAIGIGSEELVSNNFFQIFTVPKVNETLLQQIAKETGGQCFMAHNAEDMRAIYDTIDQLETIRHEAPVFSSYYDFFIPGIFLLIALVLLELFLTTFIWYSL